MSRARSVTIRRTPAIEQPLVVVSSIPSESDMALINSFKETHNTDIFSRVISYIEQSKERDKLRQSEGSPYLRFSREEDVAEQSTKAIKDAILDSARRLKEVHAITERLNQLSQSISDIKIKLSPWQLAMAEEYLSVTNNSADICAFLLARAEQNATAEPAQNTDKKKVIPIDSTQTKAPILKTESTKACNPPHIPESQNLTFSFFKEFLKANGAKTTVCFFREATAKSSPLTHEKTAVLRLF